MYDPDVDNHNYQPIKDSPLTQNSERPVVTIYSDGSYKPLINYGGYGTLMTCGCHNMMIYGGSPEDSNNRMELLAVLTALRRLNRPCEVTVVSDSQYVINALNGYIWNWCNNGWVTKQGKPVANKDLWMEMLMLCQIHHIHGMWIKGHAGHPENERCDRLATLGAYGSANLPVPASDVQLRNLEKGKYPGYEDIDEYVEVKIPNHQRESI